MRAAVRLGPAVVGLWALLGLVGAPGRVAAWATPSRFEEPVLEAGGGGRFFTGSPVDAYTCADCHSGGGKVDVQMVFPQVYTPGATYEIIVRWPTVFAHQVSAALEIVDEAGRLAGELVVPETDLPAEALCEDGEFPGTQLLPSEEAQASATAAGLGDTAATSLAPQRRIAMVEACGAHALYAYWTAPAANLGTLRFVGGVVAGDSTGAEGEYVDASGDSVTLISRQITIANDTRGVSAPEIQFQCTARPSTSHSQTPVALLALLSLVGLWLRRFNSGGRVNSGGKAPCRRGA